jgi:hypothetical protein
VRWHGGNWIIYSHLAHSLFIGTLYIATVGVQVCGRIGLNQQANRPLYQGMGVGPWSLQIYARHLPTDSPRSGMAYKYGMDISGVIDADCRGPLGVILFNYSPQDFDVNPGDRIAQAILEQICIPGPIVDALISETLPVIGTRGSDGFWFNGCCDYYFFHCFYFFYCCVH